MTTASKEEALDLLEQTRKDYLWVARSWAYRIYRERRRPISVDDVREIYPPPANINPVVMGAVFHKTMWRPVGYTTAKGHCHNRMIRTFVPRDEPWPAEHAP